MDAYHREIGFFTVVFVAAIGVAVCWRLRWDRAGDAGHVYRYLPGLGRPRGRWTPAEWGLAAVLALELLTTWFLIGGSGDLEFAALFSFLIVFVGEMWWMNHMRLAARFAAATINLRVNWCLWIVTVVQLGAPRSDLLVPGARVITLAGAALGAAATTLLATGRSAFRYMTILALGVALTIPGLITPEESVPAPERRFIRFSGSEIQDPPAPDLFRHVVDLRHPLVTWTVALLSIWVLARVPALRKPPRPGVAAPAPPGPPPETAP